MSLSESHSKSLTMSLSESLSDSLSMEQRQRRFESQVSKNQQIQLLFLGSIIDDGLISYSIDSSLQVCYCFGSDIKETESTQYPVLPREIKSHRSLNNLYELQPHRSYINPNLKIHWYSLNQFSLIHLFDNNQNYS